MSSSSKFPPEFRERAVHFVLKEQYRFPNIGAAIQQLAPQFGCSIQTLHRWVQQHERDDGKRKGLTTQDRMHLRSIDRFAKELRQAQSMLDKLSKLLASEEAYIRTRK